MGLACQYKDQCLLWDDNCKGDRGRALDRFYNSNGTLYYLVYHPCGYTEHERGSFCAPWAPAAKVSAAMFSFLHQSDCLTSWEEWHSSYPEKSIWTHKDWAQNNEITVTVDLDHVTSSASFGGCCDGCGLSGGK